MAVQQGGVVRYSKTTSELMPQVPLIDGQILFISDTAELYIDDGTERKKISCSCEHTDSSAPYSAVSSSAPPSSSAASSAPKSSSVASSAPPSSELEEWRHKPITVPSYASNVTVYETDIYENTEGQLFTEMREVANTSNGNYERLEVTPSIPLSPSTSISSLVGSTIYVNVGTEPRPYLVVVFEDANGVKSDADVIHTDTATLKQSGEATLTIAWFNGNAHLYTETMSNLPDSPDNIRELYLHPPITATDFKVTYAANGYTIIDTSNAIFNCITKGVVLIPDGLDIVNFTGQSIPTAVAGNAIILAQIGASQTAASVTESLYDRGILSKPMSLYTSADIGSTINIPLNNGSTIPFTIVGLNWYKCTDSTIGKTLVLWANEAVAYRQFDNGTVRCTKSSGCDEITTYYQGGRAFWPVSDLRSWLNNDWLNSIDSTLRNNNLAEVEIPNVVPSALYDSNTYRVSKDVAFILSPSELNIQAGPYEGFGSPFTPGTRLPYFRDNSTAVALRAKADMYWTRSHIYRQQISANVTGVGDDSYSSVMLVTKNSSLTSSFTHNKNDNSLITDGGTQYKWCSGELIYQFGSDRYKCASNGEFGSAVAKSTKAVVPAIVLYDKYS